MGANTRLPLGRGYLQRIAASSGNFDMLTWARGNGCPLDGRTCASAATAGRLDTLQWARAHGCPWNEGTCVGAAEGGYEDIASWVKLNGGAVEHVKAEEFGYEDYMKWVEALRGGGFGEVWGEGAGQPGTIVFVVRSENFAATNRRVVPHWRVTSPDIAMPTIKWDPDIAN